MRGCRRATRILEDISVFHQMASAPAVSPDCVSFGALVGVALAACLAGGAAFARRDLTGE